MNQLGSAFMHANESFIAKAVQHRCQLWDRT